MEKEELLLRETQNKFISNLRELVIELAKYECKSYNKNMNSQIYEAYYKWLYAMFPYEECDKFTGKKPKMEGIDKLLSNTDVYQGLPLKWKFRFSKSFLDRFAHQAIYKKEEIMRMIFKISLGNFRIAICNKVGPLPFMATFIIKYYKESFLFCILPERVPLISNKGKVSSYKYYQYLRFIDFGNSEKALIIKRDEYLKEIKNHPDKFIGFNNAEYFSIAPFINIKTISDLKNELLDSAVNDVILEGNIYINYRWIC